MKTTSLQVSTTDNLSINDVIQIHSTETRWWVKLGYYLLSKKPPARISIVVISTIDRYNQTVTVRDRF